MSAYATGVRLLDDYEYICRTNVLRADITSYLQWLYRNRLASANTSLTFISKTYAASGFVPCWSVGM